MPENESPAPAPERRRAAQRKLTAADKAALVEVLKRPDVRVDGKIDVKTVATLTGLSYGQVYAFVRSDRYWHAQVAEADPGRIAPSEIDQIDAPAAAHPVLLTDGQISEYQSLLRQQKKMLAADWEKIGMTPEAGVRMEHYGNMGTAPTGMLLRAATGQLISNLDLLDQVIKKDAEMIILGRLPAEVDGKGEPRDSEQVERDWRYALYAGINLQLNMFAHLHKMQALVARVMADLQKLNGAKANPNKGFFEAQGTPATPDATH